MNFAEAYGLERDLPVGLSWELGRPEPLKTTIAPSKIMHAFVDADLGTPVPYQAKRQITTADLPLLTAMAAAAPSEPAYGALLHLVERHGSIVVSLRF